VYGSAARDQPQIGLELGAANRAAQKARQTTAKVFSTKIKGKTVRPDGQKTLLKLAAHCAKVLNAQTHSVFGNLISH
jgi:predicted RNA-binding Zn ribbon-like protein